MAGLQLGKLKAAHNIVTVSNPYCPPCAKTHLELDLSYQKKDTSIDLYKKTFSFSRGYEAMSTVRMYKLGATYHFPLLYPDMGFANLFYVQRVRANVFFDYTSSRFNSSGPEVKNRSMGTEIYFDTRIWNSFPLTFGLRFAHLMDKNSVNP